jgi:hypothetical protein
LENVGVINCNLGTQLFVLSKDPNGCFSAETGYHSGYNRRRSQFPRAKHLVKTSTGLTEPSRASTSALEARILGRRQIVEYRRTMRIDYRRFVATPVT